MGPVSNRSYTPGVYGRHGGRPLRERFMQTRRIVGFFLRFLIVYAVLMALWPVARGVYSRSFRSGGELVAGFFGSRGEIRIRALTDQHSKHDTSIVVRHRDSQTGTKMEIGSMRLGYRPTALLVGLIAASSIPWMRRVRALLWGLVLLHAFVALRLAIIITWGLSMNEHGWNVVSNHFWNEALHTGIWSVSVGVGMSYIAPVVIWIMVSLRRADLAMFLPAHRDVPAGNHNRGSNRHSSRSTTAMGGGR